VSTRLVKPLAALVSADEATLIEEDLARGTVLDLSSTRSLQHRADYLLAAHNNESSALGSEIASAAKRPRRLTVRGRLRHDRR